MEGMCARQTRPLQYELILVRPILGKNLFPTSERNTVLLMIEFCMGNQQPAYLHFIRLLLNQKCSTHILLPVVHFLFVRTILMNLALSHFNRLINSIVRKFLLQTDSWTL